MLSKSMVLLITFSAVVGDYNGLIVKEIKKSASGKVVNPRLYIACGISSAVQHFAGMKTSKIIVAINSDKDAPIFNKCDYGIIGDIFRIVPALTAELAEGSHKNNFTF